MKVTCATFAGGDVLPRLILKNYLLFVMGVTNDIVLCWLFIPRLDMSKIRKPVSSVMSVYNLLGECNSALEFRRRWDASDIDFCQPVI